MTKPDNEFSEYETHYFNGKPEGYVTLALYHKLYAAYLTRVTPSAEAPSDVVEHYATSRADGFGYRDCSCGARVKDGQDCLPSHQPLAEEEAVEIMVAAEDAAQRYLVDTRDAPRNYYVVARDDWEKPLYHFHELKEADQKRDELNQEARLRAAYRALSNRTVTKGRTIRATYKGVLENGIFHEHERTFEEVVPPANSEGQFVVTGITPIPMCQTCGSFDWRNRTVGGK